MTKSKLTPEARAAINRANAQHSTGPRTAAGKVKSSRNSFQHGLYSDQLVIPGESTVELDELRATLRSEHQPANMSEEILVNEIAEQFWRIRRMRKLENDCMRLENIDSSLSRLAVVQRTMASAERGLHKSLATLRRLQLDRGFVPQHHALTSAQPLENGFVPLIPVETLSLHRAEPAIIPQNAPPPLAGAA